MRVLVESPTRSSLPTAAWWSLFLLVVVCGGAAATDGTTIITSVYTNGRIYTGDMSNSWAEAIAVDENGVLVAVGTTAEVKALSASSSSASSSSALVRQQQLHDLEGRLVVPGFHDVHLHAVEAGINAQLCYVPEETRSTDLAERLGECEDSGKFGGEGWILAAGVDIGLLLEIIYTNVVKPLPIDVLDRAFPDTPVCILDNIGHGAVVNSEALRRVGLLDESKVTPGGQVLRDEDGYPFGIVMENAQQVFRDAAFPANSTANQQIAYDSLLGALRVLNRNGITSVSDAGGFWRQAQTEAWGRALLEGKLTVRARYFFFVVQCSRCRTRISFGSA